MEAERKSYRRLTMEELTAVRDFINEQARQNPDMPAVWLERLKVAELAHLSAERERGK